MIYRFTTPNPSFNGLRSGIQFYNGHAETDSAAIADDLIAMGYTLVETVAPLARLGKQPEPEELLNPVAPLRVDAAAIAPELDSLHTSKPKRKTR